MYTAYYVERGDADGDLIAVIVSEDGGVSEELSQEFMTLIQARLEEEEDWFKVESGDCDFPDVWDRTSHIRMEGVIDATTKLFRPQDTATS